MSSGPWFAKRGDAVKKWVLIGLAGMVAGVIAWGGFNTALEATNSMTFCISCHVMRDTVSVEYQQSPHFQNPSGVRATCPDCHVPRDWSHKLIRKIQASGELFHWAAGSIDTAEKFEAKRHTLAVREWDRMRANDSRECRNCHSFEAMAFHKQSMKASRAMRDAAKDGKTCIDCHKAVAHKMPDVTANHRRLFTALKAEAEAIRPTPGDPVVALAGLPLRPHPEADSEGELAAGHPVRVLAVAGDFVQVEISGWQRDGTPATLYARQGKRITLASLNETALARLHTLTSVEDADTGQIWTEARLPAWVPIGAFLRDAKPLWDYAERMAKDNCTLCHVQKAAGDYAANDWVGHVNSMKRLTPLTEAEAALLLTYLQGRAKDGVR
jgi:trimethylamine-N-oxide reductase (cytochrome c), cytochrome c-type subunit TorC